MHCMVVVVDDDDDDDNNNNNNNNKIHVQTNTGSVQCLSINL